MHVYEVHPTIEQSPKDTAWPKSLPTIFLYLTCLKFAVFCWAIERSTIDCQRSTVNCRS
ncbi:MAG: hypothetical protein HC849_18705 [Oscillatoriales cyanobacterium RU_3_3]|nr:hypothetical protein [Oscillatoriales cyanobacterium RU_3_3]